MYRIVANLHFLFLCNFQTCHPRSFIFKTLPDDQISDLKCLSVCLYWSPRELNINNSEWLCLWNILVVWGTISKYYTLHIQLEMWTKNSLQLFNDCPKNFQFGEIFTQECLCQVWFPTVTFTFHCYHKFKEIGKRSF